MGTSNHTQRDKQMNDEPTLFDPDNIYKQSRISDPFTSSKAAEKAAPRFGSDKEIVLRIFKNLYPEGIIDEQLEDIAKTMYRVWPGNASKRRSDLSRDGFLEYTGQTALTSANKESKVWRLKQ